MSEDIGKNLQPIWTFKIDCPRCGDKLEVSDYIYEIPLVGKVLISTGKCSSCGYKYSNARAMESHGPQKLTVKVDEPDDLNILVIRASSAAIRMPELGVEIKPGPAAQGYITTIEGVLNRALEVLMLLKDDPEVNREEWQKRKNDLEEAIKGKKKFTFIIEDPQGVSRIVSDKVEKEKLYGNYIT